MRSDQYGSGDNSRGHGGRGRTPKSSRGNKGRKQKKSLLARLVSPGAFAGYQFVASLCLLATLIWLDVLPLRYLLIIGAALLVLWAFIYFLMRKSRRKGSKVISRIFSLLLSALLLAAALIIGQTQNFLSQVSEDVENEDAVDVTKDPFTIYISGVDTRGEGDVDDPARSDVNMLMTVNPTTQQVLLTSIPRDYYVTLPSFGQQDKLTHAGMYGVSESEAAIEELMGIDINYYAKVNFDCLEELVDALGGVEVYSDKAFTPRADKSLYIEEGTQLMDGKTALAFARERKAYSTGDNHRVQNQQAVLKAIIDKASSPKVITSYSKMLSAIGGDMSTNLSSQDIRKLAKMQIKDGGSWDVQSYQLTGTGSSSTSCYSAQGQSLYVMEPDSESVAQGTAYIQAMLDGEEITVEEEDSESESE